MAGRAKKKGCGRIVSADVQLLNACKMAYRKHVIRDDDIGWDELSDVLSNALEEFMGDKNFVAWLDVVSKFKPIV